MLSYERFMVVSDNHGDEQDDGAVSAARAFMKHWKPKHRIHLGDAWDFRWLRSKASDEDRLDPALQADFDAGVDLLGWYRPSVYAMGNHCHRVIKAMRSPDPAKAKLASMLWGDMEDALRGVKPIPYNKRTGIYQFGDTKLLHGYAAGIGAVRKHALVYGRCWIGHLHTIECTTPERHDTAEGRCIGALCKKELGYNEAQLGTLRQDNGFLYGIIFSNGRTLAWQAQEVGGVWVFPSEMKEVKCAG